MQVCLRFYTCEEFKLIMNGTLYINDFNKLNLNQPVEISKSITGLNRIQKYHCRHQYLHIVHGADFEQNVDIAVVGILLQGKGYHGQDIGCQETVDHFAVDIYKIRDKNQYNNENLELNVLFSFFFFCRVLFFKSYLNLNFKDSFLFNRIEKSIH